MKTKLQLIIIISILLIAGIGSAIYKSGRLGFSFFPSDKVNVWTVETSIKFTATGGPVEVSLNLPDASDKLAVLDFTSVNKEYDLSLQDNRALWRADKEAGKEQIYFRASASNHITTEPSTSKKFSLYEADFSSIAEEAADNLVEEAESTQKSVTEKAVHILANLNSPDNADARILHDETEKFGSKTLMASAVLGKAGIPARAVKGLQLTETKNTKSLKSYIEIWDEDKLVLLSPRSA